jgi:hypothetical protein
MNILTQAEVNRLTRYLQRVEGAGGHFPEPAATVFERLCAKRLREKKKGKKSRKR